MPVMLAKVVYFFQGLTHTAQLTVRRFRDVKESLTLSSRTN